MMIAENPQGSQAGDDLIDIAENPHPSIKSFYFPPTPQEKESFSTCSRKQSRVPKDLEALLRIDGELGPLQHKLNEITGKFKALSLAIPPMLSQRHYSGRGALSSNMSGYYLHRTETFGHDSSASNVVHVLGKEIPALRTIDRPGEGRSTECVGALSYSANIGNENYYSAMCAGRSVSNRTSNWLIGEENSCLTPNNSFVHFGGRIGRDPSGSLIPSVSSSCFRSFNSKTVDPYMPNTSLYFDRLEAARSNSSFTRRSAAAASMDQPGPSRQIESMYSSGGAHGQRSSSRFQVADEYTKADQRSHFGSDVYECTSKYSDNQLQRKVAPRNVPESLYPPSTSADAGIRVISVNTQLCTTVEKHYTGRMVAGANSCVDEASGVRQGSVKNPEYLESDETSSHCPRDRSVSTSLTVIGTDDSNKTHYVNYTRVDSQTSLIISKTSQNVGTSSLEQSQNKLTQSSTHVVAKKKSSDKGTKKKLRSLEVQCSGSKLNCRRNETVLRRSVASLLKPSESEESVMSMSSTGITRRIQAPRTDEKVIIVPILFTDGIPEPSKVPLFHFSKSRCCLPNTSHRVVKLEKGASSLTQSSMFSESSGESYAMDPYLSQKLTNRGHWNSGMSVSCVSRNASLHGKSPSQLSTTVKTLSDRCQRSGKSRKPGSMISGSTNANRTYSEPTRRPAKKVIRGMRSTPEDFLCDT